MDTIIRWLVAALLGGVAVLVVAKLVPGFRVRGGFGSAVVVGLVYGVLKALLQGVLIVVTFPFVVLTLGLFIIAINAFLLWLTDKLLARLEIRSVGALVVGAVLLSVVDLVFQLVVRGGAPF